MKNELDDMEAECNSIEAIKEKYKKGKPENL